ncbi:hypothetical protein [Legionella sp. W05-934-2]|jgi:hypothetical protein|uniref:hypothetical protein n=1 Tax=Legionella sp. W05-934-2 TaxID=1198649 RepID=UPI003462342E
MKKITLVVLISLLTMPVYASKLSQYLRKHNEREQAREQKQRQLDLSFSDYSFQQERRFSDQSGKECREYYFRSRTTPFRQGNLTVCDE